MFRRNKHAESNRIRLEIRNEQNTRESCFDCFSTASRMWLEEGWWESGEMNSSGMSDGLVYTREQQEKKSFP